MELSFFSISRAFSHCSQIIFIFGMSTRSKRCKAFCLFPYHQDKCISLAVTTIYIFFLVSYELNIFKKVIPIENSYYLLVLVLENSLGEPKNLLGYIANFFLWLQGGGVITITTNGPPFKVVAREARARHWK